MRLGLDLPLPKDFLAQHDKETPAFAAIGTAGLTPAQKAERAAAAAKKKEEREKKLASDVPYQTSQWLNGVGKDLIKATRLSPNKTPQAFHSKKTEARGNAKTLRKRPQDLTLLRRRLRLKPPAATPTPARTSR